MNYSGIIKFDTGNCYGISTTLFVSGCSNNCKGCHNPHTHDPKAGKEFTNEVMKDFLSAAAHQNVNTVVLSGGDPFFKTNFEKINELCVKIKNKMPEKNIIIYTGYILENIIREGNPIKLNILKNIDYLIDGPFMIEKKTVGIDLRGSYNQRCFRIKPIDTRNENYKLMDISYKYFRDITEEDKINFNNKISITI